jgi:hypothetical protein
VAVRRAECASHITAAAYFSNIARDEGFIFFCAGIFVVQAVVQVSAWRTDSVRVLPRRARGKSIVIRCMP